MKKKLESTQSNNPAVTEDEIHKIRLMEKKLLSYTPDDVFHNEHYEDKREDKHKKIFIGANADKKAILGFIHLIATFISLDRPLPDKLKRYLISALLKISTGVNPADAFMLKTGNRLKNSRQKEISISLRVWELVKFKDFTIENALAKVAEDLSRSEGTIREIYYRNKELIDRTYEEIDSNYSILNNKEECELLII